MSEQYFNRNEPKSHFNINLYIYQLIQMSLFESGVSSNSREGQMGESIYCFPSQASQSYLHLAGGVLVSSCPSLIQYVGTQVQVNETE